VVCGRSRAGVKGSCGGTPSGLRRRSGSGAVVAGAATAATAAADAVSGMVRLREATAMWRCSALASCHVLSSACENQEANYPSAEIDSISRFTRRECGANLIPLMR